ncbi:MAG: hypothetical protein Ct9H300mP27_08620 [Chloroflexota bacterium]|nr:MAG: hypothetical protein Ct9H300mP27_08620 [Chloroflexota bacterium]
MVPEVNGQDVEEHKGIIAKPNCSTTPLAMVAHPLRELSPIKRIIADTINPYRGLVGGYGGVTRTEFSFLEGERWKLGLTQQIGFKLFLILMNFRKMVIRGKNRR